MVSRVAGTSVLAAMAQYHRLPADPQLNYRDAAG
jgi:hypothetical protein